VSVDAIIALTTCADRDEAAALAHSLVAEGLAACVNIMPAVQSVYRWQGHVEEGQEVMLLIKTSQARFDALAAAIHAQSTYELPELLVVPVSAGSAEFLSWISSSTEVK
jgi:periplasmic divalent cation tolerance protein